MLRRARRQGDPARREHAQNVPVRKQGNVAVDRARACDHAVRARATSSGVSPPGHHPEQQPAGRPLTDLSRGQPLVLAVVPLGQIGVDHGVGAKAGEFAGLPRALSRTDEHEREMLPLRAPARAAAASRRPLSVKGMSVVLVCCPLILHAVSPCLIAKTSTWRCSLLEHRVAGRTVAWDEEGALVSRHLAGPRCKPVRFFVQFFPIESQLPPGMTDDRFSASGNTAALRICATMRQAKRREIPT